MMMHQVGVRARDVCVLDTGPGSSPKSTHHHPSSIHHQSIFNSSSTTPKPTTSDDIKGQNNQKMHQVRVRVRDECVLDTGQVQKVLIIIHASIII
jgi:hypothetical protein